MGDYYVVRKDVCPTCNGKGTVVTVTDMGAEQVACSPCWGAGFIGTDVPLELALKELGILTIDALREMQR